MQDQFKLPQDRKEKIKLLKDIQSGAKSISDLFSNAYQISMWRPDAEDQDYLKNFYGDKRISKEDFEKSKVGSNTRFVTLILS